MGGAEGTKLDLDFMEMERVSSRRASDDDMNEKWCISMIAENRRHSWVSRGTAGENKRISSTESNSEG